MFFIKSVVTVTNQKTYMSICVSLYIVSIIVVYVLYSLGIHCVFAKYTLCIR